ncbi:Beta-galactosidase 3 [Sarracenia purpurea var. burkii]
MVFSRHGVDLGSSANTMQCHLRREGSYNQWAEENSLLWIHTLPKKHSSGLIRQPKYGHLKELHRAIKLSERALVSADPTVTSLGSYEQAHVFSSEAGDCAAFLSNSHAESTARVTFNNMHYDLPPWSISILPDCKNVIFNTAQVGVQTSNIQMLPVNTEILSWEAFTEDISSADDDSEITVFGLLEQLNVTRDASDYLWYSTSFELSSSESFLNGGQHLTLTVQSAGDALHVFTNGHLSGKLFNSAFLSKYGLIISS